MTGSKKTVRQTKHRRAASNPEVRERIEKLKRIWKHSTLDERARMITDILKVKGCTIRGLAEDLDLPESTIRLHLKRSSRVSKVGTPTAKQTEEPRQLYVREEGSTVPLPQQRLGAMPASSALKSMTTPSKPTPASTRPAVPEQARSKHVARPAAALPPPLIKQVEDREESLGSLRDRAGELVLDFIQAKWGVPAKPADPGAIRDILNTADTYTRTAVGGTRFVQLPASLKRRELFEITKPKSSSKIDEADPHYQGRWIATFLVSLDPNDEWKQLGAINSARRKLFPEPVKEERPSEPRRGSSFRIAVPAWRR